MAKLLLYQQKIIEQEKSMSNQELFDEVLSQSSGDDYDGMFTPTGEWEYSYLLTKLRERLADWLAVEHRVHLTESLIRVLGSACPQCGGCEWQCAECNGALGR